MSICAISLGLLQRYDRPQLRNCQGVHIQVLERPMSQRPDDAVGAAYFPAAYCSGMSRPRSFDVNLHELTRPAAAVLEAAAKESSRRPHPSVGAAYVPAA
ncbi:hypothetical protein YC2023_040047 [Brassica napus]